MCGKTTSAWTESTTTSSSMAATIPVPMPRLFRRPTPYRNSAADGDFNAEFGHSTGGVVNAAIQSGTNRLHGDLWEYRAQQRLQRQLLLQNVNGVPSRSLNITKTSLVELSADRS